jgi:hypothetical protein
MKNLIDTLGGDLVDILINDLRDGTFYARLTLDTQELDSRPSDAIALAVRFNVPIFVAEKVMEEASFIPENEEQGKITPPPIKLEGDEAPNVDQGSKLEQMQKMLEDAITKEDYEKAARIRDEIKQYIIRNS